MIKRISGTHNSKIKLYRKLSTSSKERKKQGLICLEGLRLVCDCAAVCDSLKYLFVSERFYKTHSEQTEKLARRFDEAFILDENIINRLKGVVTSQEIMAVVGASLDDISGLTLKEGGFYIALNEVKDPGNVGTIIRTAAALNFDGVIIDNCCDPLSLKCVRASMGAVLRTHLYRCENAEEFIKANKSVCTVYAAVAHGEDCFVDSNRFGRGILIVGNEAFGIKKSIINLSDLKVKIPLAEKAESLNVAAAASICMYEMKRKVNFKGC